MQEFSFIADDELRNSIEMDYKEMKQAFANNGWKTVLVLAGSIVEAILTDILMTSEYQSKTKADPSSMMLGQLLHSAREEGFLSERAFVLCDIIREYRNLIHPGRYVRLQEKPNQERAQMALAVVDIIAGDLDKKLANADSLKAEQILAKIEGDPESDLIIMEHIWQANQSEKQKLLLDLLPDRYLKLAFEHGADPAESEKRSKVMEALSSAYRSAFNWSATVIKRKALKKYISILRTERQDIGYLYDDAFFLCLDLYYLESTEERNLIIHHLFSRMQKEITSSLLFTLWGIGAFLREQQIRIFIESICKELAWGKDDEIKKKCWDRLDFEADKAPTNDIRQDWHKWLDSTIEYFDNGDHHNLAQELRGIKNSL